MHRAVGVPGPGDHAERRFLLPLAGLTGLLLAAFFFVPDVLVRTPVDSDSVGGAFRRAFVRYWESGSADFARDLDGIVDFWFRYHLVKAVVSALLLGSAVALGTVMRRRGRAVPRSRPLRAASWTAVGLVGAFALVALMANVQGAAAPFASLLPMLTGGHQDPALASTLADVRSRFDGAPGSGAGTPPALAVMTEDFALYHVVLAGLAAVVTLVLGALTVVLLRRLRRRAPGTSPRALAFAAAGSAVAAALTAVLAVANTTNAVHAHQGLALFFNGG
ncbi:tat (twin-arginine translocation) pathway signal sequence [Streptomyces sp. NPDC001941]|uniref:tat (twin-arginine translocation) pathway signal sequence n=1 Tax=Streptomyces sp. NPDC001941 TaxID=3154659 RepID=UPI003321C963